MPVSIFRHCTVTIGWGPRCPQTALPPVLGTVEQDMKEMSPTARKHEPAAGGSSRLDRNMPSLFLTDFHACTGLLGGLSSHSQRVEDHTSAAEAIQRPQVWHPLD